LSEQMTLTDPSVSTVFKDLQRILFLRMRFAVIVREAVNAIGRPSGMNAIATETQSTISVGTLIKPGCFGRKYAALRTISGRRPSDQRDPYQTMITIMIIVNIMEQMMRTKFRISLSNRVIPVFGAFVIFAILPNTVVSPVETTTPIPLPDMQWVPWRPIFFVSR
jgi:hypothetical protein